MDFLNTDHQVDSVSLIVTSTVPMPQPKQAGTSQHHDTKVITSAAALLEAILSLLCLAVSQLRWLTQLDKTRADALES